MQTTLNKVEEAATRKDVFSSYVNLCNLQCMLQEISAGVEIGSFNLMKEFDPNTLQANVELYDRALQTYAQVYQRAGIAIRRHADVDAFVEDYLNH